MQTSHAPYGTIGGGSPYLKWSDGTLLYLDTGKIYKKGQAYAVQGDRRIPLVLGEPAMCRALDGETVLTLRHAFDGVDALYAYINVPKGYLKLMERVGDHSKNSVELFDGWFYRIVAEYRVEICP
jgi:hypothetical protein